MFTKEEAQFLLNVLAQISIKATDNKALETISTIQSIADKLNEENLVN